MLQWAIGLGPGVLLILIALGMAINNASMNSPTSPVFAFFWSGFFISIIGVLVAKLIYVIKKKPEGCLSNHPTVKPIRNETTFTGKIKSAEYDFAHPIYVEQLLALNPPEVVQVNQKHLDKAIERFEYAHAD